MVSVDSSDLPIAKDLDIIQNRLAVAFANTERLVKSWTAKYCSSRPPSKTLEEQEGEDAELFRPQPLHLGLGAAIPKDWDGKEISSREKLSHLFLDKKRGLPVKKSNDAREKRPLRSESSDEEEGRSGLGKPKKLKSNNISAQNTTVNTQERREGQSIAGHVMKTNSQEVRKHTTLRSLKEQATGPKKPLVDYPSSEEEVKARLGVKSPSKPQSQPQAQQQAQSIQQNSKRSPTNSSKQSSAEPATDSEPSEMETIIPQSLTPNTLPSTPNSSLAADEAKREKKRLRRAKKRQLRKAALAGSVSHAHQGT